jgi:hypothetical protein
MSDLFPTTLSDAPIRESSRLPCRYCGSTPAVEAVFQRHTGMVLHGRTETFPGPFCRDCGLSWFRATTSHTLAVGWLGVLSLFLALPITLVRNVRSWRKVVRLGPPMPPAGQQPMDPGRPLFLRLETALVLIPLFFGVLFLADLGSHRSENIVGRCANVKAGRSFMGGYAEGSFVECHRPHNAVVTAVVDGEDRCPEGTYATMPSLRSFGIEPRHSTIVCFGASGG